MGSGIAEAAALAGIATILHYVSGQARGQAR